MKKYFSNPRVLGVCSGALFVALAAFMPLVVFPSLERVLATLNPMIAATLSFVSLMLTMLLGVALSLSPSAYFLSKGERTAAFSVFLWCVATILLVVIILLVIGKEHGVPPMPIM